MNIYTITGLAFFWVYACYGAVSVTDFPMSAAMTGLFSAMFTCLMEMGRGMAVSQVSKSSRTRFIGIGLGFILILVSLAWNELHAGLITDGFYHTGMAMAHGQRLLKSDFVPLGSRLYQKMFSLSYGSVLHDVNLTVIVFLSYILFQITTIQNKYARWLAWMGLFLGVRYLTRTYVLEGDIHPPLRLFPLMLTSLLGGVHEFAFRLPGLIALGVFASLVVELFKGRLGTITALICASCLVSLPLVWHGGVIVEGSIWSALAFAVVTLYLLASEIGGRPIPYPLLFAVISLASVMRQSTFVALVPLAIIYLEDMRHLNLSWGEKRKKLVMDCFPLILMVPWTLHIAYTGTPATDHSGTPWITKINDALRGGASLKYLWIHWRWPGFGLLCIGLIPKRSRAYYFSVGTFLLAFALFYSVKTTLWGLARYQLELGFALVSFGLLRLVLWLEDKVPRRWNGAKMGVLAGLGGIWILFNYVEFKSIRKIAGRLDGQNIFARSREGSIPSLGEYSFAISKALRMAKEKGIHRGNFLDGISYGVMPQILAGYTWDEVRQAEGMPTAWEGADPEKVHNVPNIQSITLVDWREEHNLRSVEILKKLGWSEVAQIPDEDAPDNVIWLLRRP